MKALELISPSFLEISEKEIFAKAQAIMSDNLVEHLPVVDNNKYKGLISENDLPQEAKDKAILSPIKIGPGLHFWDILKFFETTGVSVLPVVEDDNTFIGCITKAHMVDVSSALSSVKNEGAIIELLMVPRDYSLSQIAQIVEGNDVKILSVIVHELQAENLLLVILKLDSLHISGVMQTLNRYNMSVRRVYNFTDDIEWLNDRRDALLRFLDI